MSDRIPGPDVMTAFAEAIDDGVSSYRTTIFFLGVSAGQCFTRGWSSEDLDKELTVLASNHPRLAADIRKELGGLVGSPKQPASEFNVGAYIDDNTDDGR